MDAMTAKDLVGLLFERNSAWQAQWTVFYAVSAAIITLVASGRFLPKYRWRASIISGFLFIVFAIGNYHALNQLRKQRHAIVELVMQETKDGPEMRTLVEEARPPSLEWFIFYHWGLSVLVVLLLFAIPAFQKTEDT
jgi:hypothetical protein